MARYGAVEVALPHDDGDAAALPEGDDDAPLPSCDPTVLPLAVVFEGAEALSLMDEVPCERP